MNSKLTKNIGFCMCHQELLAFGLTQIKNLGRYKNEVGSCVSNQRGTEGIPEKDRATDSEDCNPGLSLPLPVFSSLNHSPEL